MLAVLLGCGLRRGELLALQLGWIQQREEHCVIADLVGKGGHVRTVLMPAWVKHALDACQRLPGHRAGHRMTRAVPRADPGSALGDQPGGTLKMCGSSAGRFDSCVAHHSR
jgi:integrase